MKRSSYRPPTADELAAFDAILKLGSRFPRIGLGVRYAGERTSEAFAVERTDPNRVLPDRFWIYADGTPVLRAYREAEG